MTDATLLAEVSKVLAPKLMIVVLVLILIGLALKNTPKVPDWLIVWILPVLGIVFSLGVLGLHVQSVLQGILSAGVAVLSHQLWKQTKHKE